MPATPPSQPASATATPTALVPAPGPGGAIQWYPTLLYLLLYFVFWSAIDTTLRQEPPIDNFEQLNWAMHPALGYAKHPPLPTLLLWAAEQIFPAGIPLTYALGAAQVMLMLWLAYLVGRETLGTYRGWLGALLITCISYHTLRMHFYNHNTALLCANAAAMLCTWHAGNTPKIRWWLLLGMSWAAGMLSKYQMALPIACNIAYLVWSRGLTRRLIVGMSIAGAAAALLLLPHFIWLVENHFPSIGYATQMLGAALTPLKRIDSLLRFLSSQLLRVAPVIVLLGVLHFMARRASAVAGTEAGTRSTPANPAARRFWAIHAFGPLLLMSLLALFGGVDLEMHWGTAFLWALPLWFLSTAAGQGLTRLRTSRTMAVMFAGQLLLIGGKLLFPHA